ncbi:hypothetical protein CEXT_227521 [Caerostris extrusa]|uniref:Uncharacterized protein n=1 Tax=Caerostris extrusa TaxID=172846 RepID=A0AAV4WMG9_CAEEX|nr:hypothetical protein CEXT_227521 [Caerostris extrusa]
MNFCGDESWSHINQSTDHKGHKTSVPMATGVAQSVHGHDGLLAHEKEQTFPETFEALNITCQAGIMDLPSRGVKAVVDKR